MKDNTEQTTNDLIEYSKNPSVDIGWYELEREMDFWTQTITRVTNNSLFCQLFAEYELYMQQILETYNKIKGEPFKPVHRIYEKYKSFIMTQLNISDYEESETYIELNKYKDLRNAMTHLASNYQYLDQNDDKGKYLDVKTTIDNSQYMSLESFLSPFLDDGTREIEVGCFYIKDNALIESVSKIMLSDADYVTKALRNLMEMAEE